ncbi:MAG: hypothetical protein ACR2O6_06825 [Ilumatobacteraceae bacterium]
MGARVDVVFGPGSSYTPDACVTAGSDAGQASPGPTGTASWALPSSDQWAAQTIAIRPDGFTDAQQGCAAVIVEFVRRIWEAIRDAVTGGSKAVSAEVDKRRRGKGDDGKRKG